MACLQSAYLDIAKNRIAEGSPQVSVDCDLILAFPGIASNFISFLSPRGMKVGYPSKTTPTIASSTKVNDGLTITNTPLRYTKANPFFTGTVTGHVPAGQVVLFNHVANITLTYNLTITIKPGPKNASVTIAVLNFIDEFAPVKLANLTPPLKFDAAFFPKIADGTACAFRPSSTDKTTVTVSNIRS